MATLLAPAPVVHLELPGFANHALYEGAVAWDACGCVANEVAVAALEGRLPDAGNAGEARKRDLAAGHFTLHSGQTLADIAWDLEQRGYRNLHVMRYADHPDTAALHAFVKAGALARVPVILEVSRAYALPDNEAGVDYHFVVVGGIDSLRGYLLANGDTRSAIRANPGFPACSHVATNWATWATLEAAGICGAIAVYPKTPAPAPAAPTPISMPPAPRPAPVAPAPPPPTPTPAPVEAPTAENGPASPSAGAGVPVTPEVVPSPLPAPAPSDGPVSASQGQVASNGPSSVPDVPASPPPVASPSPTPGGVVSMFNLFTLFQRAGANLPLSPWERAALKAGKGIFFAALIGAWGVAGPLLASGHFSLSSATVQAVIGAGAAAGLHALDKLFSAKGDNASTPGA